MTDKLKEAAYYVKRNDGGVQCALCPFKCRIPAGSRGNCGVRMNVAGSLYALTYGRAAAAALDPIEKKPLFHFHPGAAVFSLGEWGCNLKCSYCQNCTISQFEAPTRPLAPRDVAVKSRENGSIGVAYTYNEPMIAVEYVRDCALAVRRNGGKNILITNGYVNPEPLEELLPVIDAMNIDLKAFNEDFYHRLCKGALAPVLETIKAAVRTTHVELTTLLIPGENDAIPELEDLASWISENCGRETPCHLTAYFPSYQMNRAATTAAHLVHARDIFRRHLDYVYTGNVATPDGSDTRCVNCNAVVIGRKAFTIDASGLNADGSCGKCGAANNIVVD